MEQDNSVAFEDVQECIVKTKMEERKPMGKTITVKYEGEDYTLEYTRAAIKKMEARGFRINDIDSKPMTVLPELFNGAFIAHHTGIKRRVMEDMFDRISDKDSLIVKLAEMYNDPLQKMLEGEDVKPDEGIGWDADF